MGSLKTDIIGSSLIQFVGSLVYLVVAFGGYLTAQATATDIFAPLLYAGAVISVVALFVASLTTMVGFKNELLSRGARSSTIVAAFALIGLTASQSTASVTSLTLVVLVGFVFAMVGNAWAMHKE